MKPVDPNDLEESRELLVGLYQHGGCMAFAAAVHERTGWPAVSHRTADGRLVHVGLRHPSGGIFDSRGVLAQEEFSAPWHGVYGDDRIDLILDQYPTSPEQVRRAATHASILFPDLPGTLSRAERVDEFTADLAALCQRHGFAMRADGPHGIILYEAYGGESFEARFTMDGGIRFDRVLGRDTDQPASPVRTF